MFEPRTGGTAKIVMNTIIAGASGGLTAALLKPHIMKTYSANNQFDLVALCNGVLAGLVAITGACNNVLPWAAFIIGIVGGIVYSGSCKLLQYFNIDDPVKHPQFMVLLEFGV